MNIVIVKYNAGNIQSVLYALERIGATAIRVRQPSFRGATTQCISRLRASDFYYCLLI